MKMILDMNAMKPAHAKKLLKLARTEKRRFDCNGCPFYRAKNNSYPGTSLKKCFGKCLHLYGPCEEFRPKRGIGGGGTSMKGHDLLFKGGELYLIPPGGGDPMTFNRVSEALTYIDNLAA